MTRNRSTGRDLQRLPRGAGLIAFACVVVAACSGDTGVDVGKDGGDVGDAAQDTVTEAALDAAAEACKPGQQEDCDLNRPCPGIASCLQNGSGFGACGCVSCEFTLPTGQCSWSLGALGIGSVNPSFLSLKLEMGGVTQEVFSVSGAAGCGAAGGWYLVPDDSLVLCSASCDLLGANTKAFLVLGCKT